MRGFVAEPRILCLTQISGATIADRHTEPSHFIQNTTTNGWTLHTNLDVTTKAEALKVLNWYKMRWKIEEYFKILKSGFQLESPKLRTAERLAKIISICCILAWRIFWTTILARSSKKDASPMVVFSRLELKVMRAFFKKDKPINVLDYIVLLARLGGYLARKSDPPPGNQTIWKGYERLNELCEGAMLKV